MSRQARLERIVSSRLGTNIYQGSVVNPTELSISNQKPPTLVSPAAPIVLEERSEEGESDKGSHEDNEDIVGGENESEDNSEFEENETTEYENLIRPEGRKSKSQPDVNSEADFKMKSQEWDSLKSNKYPENNQEADYKKKPQEWDSLGNNKNDSNLRIEDPFKVRTYLPDYDVKKKELDKYASENTETEKNAANETNMKIKKKEVKGKKGKPNKENKKKKKPKETKTYSEIDDTDLIEGTRHFLENIKRKSIEQVENNRYKSLLGELDSFLESHKNEAVERGKNINLEPVNVNMKEFHHWLDSVDNATEKTNEEAPKSVDKIQKLAKHKKKKRSPKKEQKNSSTETLPESKEPLYPKQAWKLELNRSDSSAFLNETPIEILDEDVFNSWQSKPPHENKEIESKIIRVIPGKKHPPNDTSDVLVDIE